MISNPAATAPNIQPVTIKLLLCFDNEVDEINDCGERGINGWGVWVNGFALPGYGVREEIVYFGRILSYPMKKILLLALGALCHMHASAQENLAFIADSIRKEGILLYQHIQTCKSGIKMIEADTTGRLSLRAADYLSYRSGRDYVLIMPHRSARERPVVTCFRFDSSFNARSVRMEVGRAMTPHEAGIWDLWALAHRMVAEEPGFKKVRDTQFMIVPIVEGDRRKVYVLSAPTRSNVFVLGNDYLLQFNEANELISKTEFHTNHLMLPMGRKSAGHIHGKNNSPYISATDVCALMLYPKAFDQPSLRVVSPTHISEWDMVNNTLYIGQRM